MLPFNDSISFGAVAVNDLTHPRKTLYDKSLTTLSIVFPDQRMTLIICKQHAAIQKACYKCLSQS